MELGLLFLGTSAAVATRQRGLPGLLYIHRGRGVLLDAGEGAQRALQVAGFSPLRVDAVLVTHLHGDHVFGLPGLLQTMGLLGRRSLLLVAGPPGLHGLLEAVSIYTRWIPPYPIVVREIRPGDRLELPGGVKVWVFETRHSPGSVGYRLEEPPGRPRVDIDAARRLGVAEPRLIRRLLSGEPVEAPGGRRVEPREVLRPPARDPVVYTGDTAPCESVVRAARGASVLVHDATFTSDMEEEAHSQGHSTARDAALAARRAGVGLLVLTHISARYDDPTPLLEEARRIHPRTMVAEDYTKIVIR